MTAENGEEARQSDPLSVLRHSMCCLEGSSCTVPGCQDMRISMGHSQYCTNADCPAPPCIAMRQLTGDLPTSVTPPLSLDDIFRAAIKLTEIRPSFKPEVRPKIVQRSLSNSQSSSSSTESLFKIPKGKPRR